MRPTTMRNFSTFVLLALGLAPPANTAPTRGNDTLAEPPHPVSIHRVFDADIGHDGIVGPEPGVVNLTAGRRLPTHRVTDPEKLAHGHGHGVDMDANTTAPGSWIGHWTRGARLLGRDELPGDSACGLWYKVFFYQWIIQIPPEWWVRRYKNNAEEACSDWQHDVGWTLGDTWSMVWGECWAMDKKYESGGINWLHMRFTTSFMVIPEDMTKFIRRRRDDVGRGTRHDVNIDCSLR